jgi:ParB-like chromosome segregation protein Spo0J
MGRAALKIEQKTIPISSIEAKYTDTDNPNVMDTDQYNALVTAIRTSGFLQPLLVENVARGKVRVIDGHHRLRASAELGLKELPCIVIPKDLKNAAVGIGMNRARGEVDLSRAVAVLQSLAKTVDAPELAALSAFSDADLTSLVLAGDEESVDLDSLEIPETNTRERKERDAYVLEITFAERTAYQRARRRLRSLGEGDLAAGLLALLDNDD